MKPKPELKPGEAIIRENPGGKWRRFQAPVEIVTTQQLDEVQPALRYLENRVEEDNLHAVGLVAYEAGEAFDPALAGKKDTEFPLLWFGIYGPPEYLSTLPEPSSQTRLNINWEPEITSAQYHAGIKHIKELIAAGETYQVNYTYRLFAQFDSDPRDVFLSLARCQNPPFGTYLDLGRWVIASTSPELFFQLKGDQLESRPMKGTAARGKTRQEDLEQARKLRSSKKEQAENLMIVDMVRNDMGKIAQTGSVCVPELFNLEQYPQVWQMTSTVRSCSEAPFSEIMRAMFPPASITGAPKPRTTRIISKLEKTPRRIYTGTIGILEPQRQTCFSVAIRTLLFDRKKARAEYGVGGGIVWDSTVENEYRESQLKAQCLHDKPLDFELLETMLWTPGRGYVLKKAHLERLKNSADFFAFSLDPDQIEKQLSDHARHFPPFPQRVQLFLSPTGTSRIKNQDLKRGKNQELQLVWARKPICSKNLSLYHKTTQRQVYEDARTQAPGGDDTLLYNEQGEITETTICNIAVKLEGDFYTPPVSCGLLAGTLRNKLIARGWLKEKVILRKELKKAEEIYLLNSVRGIRRAKRFIS